MKNLLFLLVINCFLGACQDEKNTFTLKVDLQSFFDNDNVRVLINDKVVFEGEVRTDPEFAVAFVGKPIQVNLEKNTYTIKVVVNDSVTLSEKFRLTNDLFIGVNYSKDNNQVNLHYSNTLFGYR